jgi:hypothetical protein
LQAVASGCAFYVPLRGQDNNAEGASVALDRAALFGFRQRPSCRLGSSLASRFSPARLAQAAVERLSVLAQISTLAIAEWVIGAPPSHSDRTCGFWRSESFAGSIPAASITELAPGKYGRH